MSRRRSTADYMKSIWFDPEASGDSLLLIPKRVRVHLVLFRVGNLGTSNLTRTMHLRNGSEDGAIGLSLHAPSSTGTTTALTLVSGKRVVGGNGVLFEDSLWYTKHTGGVICFDSCTIFYA